MLPDPNEFVLTSGTVSDVTHKVTATLAEAGLSVVCCGGAARDAYHFRSPKDFDFIVLYDPTEAEPIDDVQAEMVDWAFTKDTDYGDIEVMLNYDESNLQLHWVVKAKYKGHRVDIISPKRRCATPQDAVRSLDTTLNAAWFDVSTPLTLVRTLPGSYPDVQDNIAVRLMYPFSCTAERIQYLRDKYPQYRYDIRPDELIQPQSIQGAPCAES